MSVFLTVLKVIGIILLVILALILLVLSLVLFVPFTYGVKGSYREKDPEGEARFSWLFRVVSVKLEFLDNKLDIYAKILGLSELGPHCVRPSEAMNALRRELSEQREYVSF